MFEFQRLIFELQQVKLEIQILIFEFNKVVKTQYFFLNGTNTLP